MVLFEVSGFWYKGSTGQCIVNKRLWYIYITPSYINTQGSHRRACRKTVKVVDIYNEMVLVRHGSTTSHMNT